MPEIPELDERLLELGARYGLQAGAVEQLRTVVRALESEPASITTVRDPTAAANVHIADSLTALEVDAVRGAGGIADLGAGGGFPALALAAALPEAHITAVESVGRKCEFIDRTAAAAAMENVTVVNARAEDWAAGIGANEVVVARALAPLAVLLEYAAPLLREHGSLVAYKARRDAAAERAGADAAIQLNMELRSVLRVASFPGSGPRHLHVYEKTGPTPKRFPRRAGMARKRPLGSDR